ncbi:TetR/AcrR family transcriptional regulator [bacterium]|nr:TetR/AcrR family transcriptional regulator [bacterium]
MEQNPKYQQILETARKLFIKHGFRRITIEEICRTAKVSKVTFYKFFKNKIDISKKVLDGIVNESYEKYDRIMASPVPFREKVEQVLLFKIKTAREFSGELIRELVEADPEICWYLQKQQKRSFQSAMEMLEQGKKEGVIRQDLDPQFYMFMLRHVNEMLKDEHLKAIFPDTRKRSEELMKFWFYGMFDARG